MFLRLAFDELMAHIMKVKKATRNVLVDWMPQLDPVRKAKGHKLDYYSWRALYQDRYPLRIKCPTVVTRERDEQD